MDRARPPVIIRNMGGIGDIKLFASLGEENAKRFAPTLTWRTVPANELVIDMDDASNDVLFVVNGSVRVIHRAADGKQVILGELGPGSMFGEMAAIDGIPRSASVTTLRASQIGSMRGAAFMEVLAAEPEVCRTVLNILVGRIRSLNQQLTEHAYLTAVERLYAELLRLSRPRAGHDGQRSISPPPTQQDLAERIGSRREVVSRALSTLEKEALVEKTRGALVLTDPGALNRRISLEGLWVKIDQ